MNESDNEVESRRGLCYGYNMAFLTRIDAAQNARRFYSVRVMPTLFGEWEVMREWGRIGGTP